MIEILFVLTYILILYDVVNTEYCIFGLKCRELNPVMKVHPIRWMIDFIKIYVPLALHLSSWILVVIYGIIAFNNTRTMLKKFKEKARNKKFAHDMDLIMQKARIKYGL